MPAECFNGYPFASDITTLTLVLTLAVLWYAMAAMYHKAIQTAATSTDSADTSKPPPSSSPLARSSPGPAGDVEAASPSKGAATKGGDAERSSSIYSRRTIETPSAQKWAKILKLLSLGIVLLFPTACNTVAKLLGCVQQEVVVMGDVQNLYVLVANPSIQCYKGDHSGAAIFAWVVLVVVVLGVPMSAALYLYRQRHAVPVLGQTTSGWFRWCGLEYTPPFGWFHQLHLLLILTLAMAGVYQQTEGTALGMAIVVVLVVTVVVALMVRMRPFYPGEVRIILIYTLVCKHYVNSLLRPGMHHPAHSVAAMVPALLTLVCAVYVVVVYICIQGTWKLPIRCMIYILSALAAIMNYLLLVAESSERFDDPHATFRAGAVAVLVFTLSILTLSALFILFYKTLLEAAAREEQGLPSLDEEDRAHRLQEYTTGHGGDSDSEEPFGNVNPMLTLTPRPRKPEAPDSSDAASAPTPAAAAAAVLAPEAVVSPPVSAAEDDATSDDTQDSGLVFQR